VISTAAAPLQAKGGLVVLRGNLCPDGAVLKRSAASEKLQQHEGRAVVFRDAEDLAARMDADDLDVTPEDILVLQNAGPIGAPGMPESGYLPIPRKLARQGVKDMLRISDARMSGTAFGTIVLHIAPESAVPEPRTPAAMLLLWSNQRVMFAMSGENRADRPRKPIITP